MKIIVPILLFSLSFSLAAQWNPGDVYREYQWVTPEGGEEFLRIGGRYGYTQTPGKFPDSLQAGDQLIMPGKLDLNEAVRAELVMEKVLSHEDSRNLRVSVNGNAPLSVAEPTWVPEPQTEYMYHTEVKADVPLEQLIAGGKTRLKFTLDTTQRWDWPQNLLYGITLRVYYASTTSSAPAAAPPKVVLVNQQLGEVVYLNAQASTGTQHVDYILVGRDTDWSGRGENNRKHWQTHRGKALRTIGHSTAASNAFSVRWNTEWLPDQEDFGIQIRSLGADGKYRVSSVMTGLSLAPRPYQVTLYAPGPAPRNWVTRSGEFSQKIAIPDAVDDVSALQLHWVSWSPCYSNGLFLNGHLLWQRSDDCYVFATHDPAFTDHDVKALQQGENVIHTALTPRFRGEMVHGMEVQWPGVQLKVRRGKGATSSEKHR